MVLSRVGTHYGDYPLPEPGTINLYDLFSRPSSSPYAWNDKLMAAVASYAARPTITVDIAHERLTDDFGAKAPPRSTLSRMLCRYRQRHFGKR